MGPCVGYEIEAYFCLSLSSPNIAKADVILATELCIGHKVQIKISSL